MDLSVLIVSYNTRALTLACLASVFKETEGITYEVIVVDNASQDASARAIADRFPSVKLIEPRENIGFARANNLAAKQARGRFLLLLNPDTVVLEQAIQKAVAFAQAHEEAGIVGGRTLYPDGSLNYSSCYGLTTPWGMLCSAIGISACFPNSEFFNPGSLGGWKRDTIREVEIVSGCFLLIRRALWQKLGGFDESFFMYGEETDLCLRARKLGYRCFNCPEATIIHYGGASETIRSDKMVRLFTAKSQLLARHWSAFAARFGVAMLDLRAFTRVIGFGVAGLLSRRHRNSYRVWRDVWRKRGAWRSALGPSL